MMEEGHKLALRKCRVRLVRDLSINDMFDPIETCSLFTPIMLECIKAKESRPEKVRCFLDNLQRRGPDAFDKFLYCLRESGHDFVVSYVMQEYLSYQNSSEQQNPHNTLPGSIYLSQETEAPGDVEMGENTNSQGDINPGVNTMETSSPAQTGVQESQSNVSSPSILTGRSQSNMPGPTSQRTYLSSNIPSTVSMRTYASATSASSINQGGYTGNYDEEYKMESNPRGFLLIINNKEFSSDLGIRTGTDVDCDKLMNLFVCLGFLVEARHNLTAREIKDNLQLLSQYEKLYNVDSLAVALLTHGNEDFLYGVDGRYINVNEAFESFTAEKCPALHHKPKLFIINACRGDAEDRGSLPSGVHETSGAVSTDVKHIAPDGDFNVRIPNMKDFLVAYSTIPGHVSWRHLNDGSFFIQGFVNIFQKHAHNKDVLKMLVMVNDEVSKKVNHQGVQIPAPQVMLTKTWYLNPIVRSIA